MLFGDDIMLVDKSKEGKIAKLEGQQEALESKDFKNKSYKTECMNCNFNGLFKELKRETPV